MLNERQFAHVRRICSGILLLWVGSVFVYPVWIGRSYNPSYNPDKPNQWRQGGEFGLEGGGLLLLDPVYARAPLWRPPRVNSTLINASVLWPWQRVSQRYNVELSWLGITILLVIGALAFGPVLKILHWLTEPQRTDIVVYMAWWGSLVLGVSSVGAIVVVMVTLGAILELWLAELWLMVFLFVSYLAGVIYGYGQFRLEVFAKVEGPSQRSIPQPDEGNSSSEMEPNEERFLDQFSLSKWRSRGWIALKLTLVLFAVGCLPVAYSHYAAQDKSPSTLGLSFLDVVVFVNVLVCIATASISGIYFLGVVIYILTHHRYWSGSQTARKVLHRDFCVVLLVVIVYSIAAGLINLAI